MNKLKMLFLILLTISISYGITLDNFKDGETIRYTVPLLRGTLKDKNLKEIKVINLSSKRDTREIKGAAYNGKFKGMAELVKGQNEIVIVAGDEKLEFTINYKPQTNPIKVKAVYFTDSEGNTEYQSQFKDDKYDYQGKFDTNLKITQAFVADWMNQYGYGRKTFALELDDNGKVKVHVVKGKLPTAEYEKMGRYPIARTLYAETLEQLKDKDCVYYAVTPMSRHLPNGRSTCYGMVNIGFFSLVGGSIFYTWPDSLNDVTTRFMQDEKIDKKLYHADDGHGGTIWGTAAHTIGAGLHEMIHGFYVPHCADPTGVMSFGYGQFNRYFTFYEPAANKKDCEAIIFEDNGKTKITPVVAAALAPTKFLALDDKSTDKDNLTTISVDYKTGEIVIKNERGIRLIAIEDWTPNTGPWADWFVEFKEPQVAPKEYRIKASDIKKKFKDSIKKVGIRVIDDRGVYFLNHKIASLISEPSVLNWHYYPNNTSLTNKNVLASTDPKRLDKILKAAMKEPLLESTRNVILLPPRKYSDNFNKNIPVDQIGRAVYAVRNIKVEKDTVINAVVKGDPIMRLWLNDKNIATFKDQKAHEVPLELKKGSNYLLCEISQYGGWFTFSVQLKDKDGQPLIITDKGYLKKEASIKPYLSKF